jgi:hypothetical protein
MDYPLSTEWRAIMGALFIFAPSNEAGKMNKARHGLACSSFQRCNSARASL